MKRKPNKSDEQSEFNQILNRLDTIIAILLRQIDNESLEKWNKKEKVNIVSLLLNSNLSNEDISKTTGMAYQSVANIRSKKKVKK